MEHIKSLDGLRGIAALMVLWAHFPQVGGSALSELIHRIPYYFKFGYLGVDIFFVLSGFLITRIILNEKKLGTFTFKRFYIKRVLRIFPIYYLTLFFCLFVFGGKDFYWHFFYLSNYFFSFNFDPSPLRHIWSLAVEEQFYLFWPLILFFIPNIKLKFVVTRFVPVLSIGLAIVTCLVFSSEISSALIYRGTPYRMLSLSLGSGMAFYENDIPKKILISVMLIFSGLFLSALVFIFRHYEYNLFGSVLVLCGNSLFCLGLVLFIICADMKKYRIRYLFDNRVFSYFGRISYGLYLYHLVILYFFGYSHMNDFRYVNVGTGFYLLLICVLLPTISYYFFEKPFLSLKNRIFI